MVIGVRGGRGGRGGEERIYVFIFSLICLYVCLYYACGFWFDPLVMYGLYFFIFFFFCGGEDLYRYLFVLRLFALKSFRMTGWFLFPFFHTKDFCKCRIL